MGNMEDKQEDLKIPVKPPLIYLLSILAGFLMQWLLPIKVLPTNTITIILGILLIVIGLTFLLGSVRLFKQADTAVNHNTLPTTLVTTGFYKYTRNPIYVGFTLFQMGLGLAFGNIWIWLTLIPALFFMTYKVIQREEAFLEGKFGQPYIEYKATVRRWL